MTRRALSSRQRSRGRSPRSPSPYGEVLTLHLEHGLSAKEIAAALRRPDGTVRTQVVRAMEFLRAALPAGFAIGALVTAAPGRGLAAVREAVLAKVASKQIAVAGTMAAAGTIGGILIMKQVLLAGGAMLLAGVAWTAWSAFSSVADAPSGTEAAAPATAASRSVADSRDAKSGRSAEGVIAAERRAVVSEPTATSGGLHLEVRWQEDGTPAANVHVSYRTHQTANRNVAYGSTRSDDRGAATFATLAPGEYRVRACETSEETFVVEADQTTRATLEIRADVVLAGVVVDPTGTPVAGAAVRSMTTPELPTLTTSRGDGAFAWRGSYVSEIWAEKPGRAPSRAQVVQPSVGNTLHAERAHARPLLGVGGAERRHRCRGLGALGTSPGSANGHRERRAAHRLARERGGVPGRTRHG